MNDFFKNEKINITITDAYYTEPEYPTIMENIANLVTDWLSLFR